MSNVFRNIPSVNELLESPPLKQLADQMSRSVLVTGVRNFLANLRTEAKTTAADWNVPAAGDLAERVAQWILREEQPALRPVINATGVILHTGLGRAPLAKEAIAAMAGVAEGYCNLEVDLETGERSQRMRAVEDLLRRLTGAEAALVVNNNAAATLLALAALAVGKEVVVSRGQLVEIGGSYRLPDVMAASGARLREVGTTNKTRLSDYEAAIGPDTAALLRAHTSNYKIVGFTEETSLEDLAKLGKKHELPVIDDIGSGALLDFKRFGVTGEPLIADSLRAGAGLVLFSGDKLLGGPQCGVALGRRALVERMAKHPLARATRVDKLTLAALEATLHLYRADDTVADTVPLLTLLSTPLENLKNRAERLAPQIAAAKCVAAAEAIACASHLGGGSTPGHEIASYAVAITPQGMRVDELARLLRVGRPAVFGRVKDDRLLLDLRAVFPRQDIPLVEAVEAVSGKTAPSAPAN